MNILKIKSEYNKGVKSKKNEVTCEVVAITAFVNEENKKKCYKVGMVDVMHKPVNYLKLKAVFNKYYYLWLWFYKF